MPRTERESGQAGAERLATSWKSFTRTSRCSPVPRSEMNKSRRLSQSLLKSWDKLAEQAVYIKVSLALMASVVIGFITCAAAVIIVTIVDPSRILLSYQVGGLVCCASHLAILGLLLGLPRVKKALDSRTDVR
jgi:hypothetical protein